MEKSFWINKWTKNEIGFHLDAPNPFFINNFDSLNLEKDKTIFLPLCGKTKDIQWLLHSGYKVIGVELSELAIIALFKELNITPVITQKTKLTQYKSEFITCFVGDFFDLTSSHLGEINAIYDRAALVALPPKTRQKYTKHLISITPKTSQLLIVMEYDQSIVNGPPFSISEQEINNHYSTVYSIQLIQEQFSEKGLKGKFPINEKVYLLQ